MAVEVTSAAGPMLKKTLVTLSHAIEQAALGPAVDGPVVVIALFQRLPFFDRERETYSRLAAHADVVVVGFVDDFRPALSGRIHPVLLDLDEPLAREWTVVVATPQMGAYLVAYDEETVAAGERTLENGRLFGGRWGFGRAGAHAEVRRLGAQLGRPAAARRAGRPRPGQPRGAGAGVGGRGPGRPGGAAGRGRDGAGPPPRRRAPRPARRGDDERRPGPEQPAVHAGLPAPLGRVQPDDDLRTRSRSPWSSSRSPSSPASPGSAPGPTGRCSPGSRPP